MLATSSGMNRASRLFQFLWGKEREEELSKKSSLIGFSSFDGGGQPVEVANNNWEFTFLPCLQTSIFYCHFHAIRFCNKLLRWRFSVITTRCLQCLLLMNKKYTWTSIIWHTMFIDFIIVRTIFFIGEPFCYKIYNYIYWTHIMIS